MACREGKGGCEARGVSDQAEVARQNRTTPAGSPPEPPGNPATARLERDFTPTKRLSAYEAARKAGIIGCIDGPPDLARNRRKYLRRALRASGRELRIRCVVRPDRSQALLIDRLGLNLPERLRVPQTVEM